MTDEIDLQTAAWTATESKGFFDGANIPAACHNQLQMESFLSNVENVGRLARFVRKNHSVPATLPAGNDLLRNPLLLAQFVRLVEEVGELSAAILSGDKESAIIESADVYVTNANVHTTLGARLVDSVPAKLNADMKRGYMHGEVAR